MMGIREYRESQYLANEGSFYGLLMATMRKAGGVNLEKLKSAFPEQWAELSARYDAPGGCLNDAEIKWLTCVLESETGETEDD
jgi:hypothetical protein